MSEYSLVEEGDDYFLVRNAGGQTAPIAKQGLSETQQNEIRGFPSFVDLSAAPPAPSLAPTPYAPKTDRWLPRGGLPSGTAPVDAAAPVAGAPQQTTPDVAGDPVFVGSPATAAPATAAPAPAAPTSAAPIPIDPLKDYQRAFDMQQRGIEQSAQAQAAGAEAQAMEAAALQQTLQRAQDDFARRRAELDEQTATLERDVQNKTIDPNRFWNEQKGLKGGANRVLAMIGLFLGGMAQSRTGVNPAGVMLQKAIDDDINAQRLDLNKKENLLAQNFKKYGDLTQAEQASRLDIMSMFDAQMKQIAAQTQSEAVKANALVASGQLQGQMAEIKDRMAKEAALRKLNIAVGGGIIPDAVVPALDEKMQSRLVRVGENQNALARSEEDARALKEAEPAVANALRLVRELKSDLQEGRAGAAMFGDIPLLGDRTEKGREGRDRQAEIINALQEVGRPLRITEYTNEAITKRLVPNVAQWTGSKQEEIDDLTRLEMTLLDRVAKERSARLLTYDPGNAAPTFKKGVAR